MKLAPRDLARFIAQPDAGLAGVLLFGPDPMRVALKRQELVRALSGPQAEAEMRVTRLQASDLRTDPAALADAMRARGFFPGPRVVLLEDASDLLSACVAAVLSDHASGDAQLVVSAGNLKPSSSLRKLFESARQAAAAGIYDDPPTRAEITETLRAAGLSAGTQDAFAALETLARTLDPGDFRQTVEKISLYKLSDPQPLTSDDIAACAPVSTEAALDDVIMAAAEGRQAQVGPLLRRLQAQGVDAVRLCIAASRHFRQLHAASCDPEGPQSGVSRLRPPVHWKLRDRMIAQARGWGQARLERALGALTETDLTLRSATDAPSMAVMERTLIRLARMQRPSG